MAAVSLAIIGKGNEPLYLREFPLLTDMMSQDDGGGTTSSSTGSSSSSSSIDNDDAALFGLRSSNTSNNNNDTTDTSSSTSPTTQKACSLRQEFILHAALDRFVQLNGPPPGFAWRHYSGATTATPTHPSSSWNNSNSNNHPQFVGLLGPWEDLLLYGWMTTTQIKFIVAIQDTTTTTTNHNDNDNDVVVRLLRRLHALYVEYRLNPLGPLTGPIQSKRFDAKVQQTIQAYNRSVIV